MLISQKEVREGINELIGRKRLRCTATAEECRNTVGSGEKKKDENGQEGLGWSRWPGEVVGTGRTGYP